MLEVSPGLVLPCPGVCRLQQSFAAREASRGFSLGDRAAFSLGGSEEMLSIKKRRSKGHFSQASPPPPAPSPSPGPAPGPAPSWCECVLVPVQGSMDEDLHLSSDGTQSMSSDLAALTRSDSGQMAEPHPRSLSFEAKRKLSSSASNLAAVDGGRQSEQTSRHRAILKGYERSLEEQRRENAALSDKLAAGEVERSRLDKRLKAVVTELESSQAELARSREAGRSTQEQIDALATDKEVAMRDNADSYKRMLQSATQLRELQSEKEILVQHRDIANREREKMASDNIAMKRKLDAIKMQRQKDANDLSTMRVLKDKVGPARPGSPPPGGPARLTPPLSPHAGSPRDV